MRDVTRAGVAGGGGSVRPRLPDEIILRLRELNEASDGVQWLLGDYLVDVVSELAPYWERAGIRNGRAAIIGDMAAAVGCDASTLRDRQCMAEFYPAPVRAEYPVLTYHQLRACKGAGDAWREYAEWAVSNLASVAKIRGRIKADKTGQAEWIGRLEHIKRLSELVMDEAAAPAKLRALLRVVAGW